MNRDEQKYINPTEDSQLDKKIEETMKKEFVLPESVRAAKDKAFEEIRQQAARSQSLDKNSQKAKKQKSHKKITAFTRAFGGMAAAAAVFSVICISNPAFASNIPVIGHVFENLGTTMGFSGDFSEYAKQLETEQTAGEAVKDQTEKVEAESGNEAAVSKEAVENGAYTKTVNGVTVTLSEVYCNDVALYLSMVISSENPLPDTMVDQFGKQKLDLNSAQLTFSYNPDSPSIGDYLDGKLIDANTYAGVLRINLDETNAFVSGEGTVDADSLQYVDIPDSFTLDLNIPKIVGYLPLDQVTTPEMPQEFQDAYDQALSEQGLDMKNYDNFTEDQQEIERQLFQEMYNKYYEKYPEAMQSPNHYENWWFDGAWEFSLDITKDHSKTVTKEVNLLDESGAGIVSVTRTPFEISLETVDPEIKYVCVALDADGKALEDGGGAAGFGSLAIRDSNVDTIDLYVVDYYEYMDELKGWRLEENDVQAELGKTYKELLDERALMHTEVKFS